MSEFAVPDIIKKRERWGQLAFGVLGIAALVALGNLVLPAAITFVTALTSLAIKALVLGGVVAVGGVVALSAGDLFRLFKVLNRRATNFFVAVMPIEYMEERLQFVEERRDQLRMSIEKIGAQRESFKRDVDELRRENQTLMGQAKRVTIGSREAEIVGSKLKNNQSSLEAREQQLATLERLMASMKQALEICDFRVVEISDAVKTYKRDYAAALATSEAVNSARAVLFNTGEGAEEYEAAVWEVGQRVSESMAAVDMLLTDMQGPITEQKLRKLEGDDIIARIQQAHSDTTGVRVDASVAAAMAAPSPGAAASEDVELLVGGNSASSSVQRR